MMVAEHITDIVNAPKNELRYGVGDLHIHPWQHIGSPEFFGPGFQSKRKPHVKCIGEKIDYSANKENILLVAAIYESKHDLTPF